MVVFTGYINGSIYERQLHQENGILLKFEQYIYVGF